MRELKPCPFCGGEAVVKVCDRSGAYIADAGTEMYYGRAMTHCLIMCKRCRVRTQANLTRLSAFKAWNIRAWEEQQ